MEWNPVQPPCWCQLRVAADAGATLATMKAFLRWRDCRGRELTCAGQERTVHGAQPSQRAPSYRGPAGPGPLLKVTPEGWFGLRARERLVGLALISMYRELPIDSKKIVARLLIPRNREGLSSE